MPAHQVGIRQGEGALLGEGLAIWPDGAACAHSNQGRPQPPPPPTHIFAATPVRAARSRSHPLCLPSNPPVEHVLPLLHVTSLHPEGQVPPVAHVMVHDAEDDKEPVESVTVAANVSDAIPLWMTRPALKVMGTVGLVGQYLCGRRRDGGVGMGGGL